MNIHVHESVGNNDIKALFAKMAQGYGCRPYMGDKGVEFQDQYGTQAFYMAGKLTFSFSKDAIEEDLLDQAEKITGYGPAVITSDSSRVRISLKLSEAEAVDAVKDYFEVD